MVLVYLAAVSMISTIMSALWFFLPAAAANGFAVVAAKLPLLSGWEAPLDFGVSWRGKRLLADHKTWRGLITGMILSTLTLALQQWLYRAVPSMHSLVNELPAYSTLPLLILGPLLGLGALGGDAVKSFFKRRVGVQPGERWFPFDQIDYIVGAEAASAFVVVLPLPVYAAAIIIFVLLQIAASYIGYVIGVKEKPY